MKWMKPLLPIAFLSTILMGCWDKLELEEQAYTVVLGLDKAGDGLVKVTFQIANPQVGSSDTGSAPNEPSSDTISFTTPDILSAKEMANAVVTRKISFAHLRTLVVCQEFAKDALFHRILSTSMRDPEMRREVHLIVSKENASEFIHKNKPKLETRPHKYFAFMQERWRDTGLVPYSTLNRYFTRLTEDTLFLSILATTEKNNQKPKKNEDDYLAGNFPQESGDPTQLIGSAVFKGGRMIGMLTGEETRYVLLLRHRSLAHSFISTLPDPVDDRYQVSVRMIKSGNTKVKVDVTKEPAAIQVTVPLRLQLLSIPSFVNYALDTQKQELLTESIQQELNKDMMELVKKCQREFKGDPFLWNLSARHEFWTREQFEAYDWSKQFPKADVKIQFDMKLESFGKQIDSPQVEVGAGSE
ncbi:Ger(x)C family spore germination protein [Paenibacillus chartarius]|uniref:Ger(X)C family spore germination protein n=1 Tax=Paenibacillus chartarius TaxID=747481 RepID=A0ABV6DID7_9BACL